MIGLLFSLRDRRCCARAGEESRDRGEQKGWRNTSIAIGSFVFLDERRATPSSVMFHVPGIPGPTPGTARWNPTAGKKKSIGFVFSRVTARFRSDNYRVQRRARRGVHVGKGFWNTIGERMECNAISQQQDGTAGGAR